MSHSEADGLFSQRRSLVLSRPDIYFPRSRINQDDFGGTRNFMSISKL